MQRLLRDLRFGGRMLMKTPAASATVLLALSLGIGLSTLTYSLIEGAVLPVLPVEEGERIVRVHRAGSAALTAEDYAHWEARQRSFEGLGAYDASTVTLATEGVGGEPVSMARITPSLLPTLRVEPALGRRFTAEDALPGAPAVALVGHALWRDRLGSDPDAIGRVVRVDGRPAEIIGVMPDGFGFPWDQQLWTPLDLDPLRAGRDAVSSNAELASVVGRLRPDASAAAAAGELTALTRALDATRGDAATAESTVTVRRYTDLFSDPGGSTLLAALMLGIAFVVLLVACANVANVLLARAVDRSREVAVRVALGASRSDVTSQLLTEVSILATVGAAAGVAVAVVGGRIIEAAMPPGMPYWMSFPMDLSVLAFVVLVAGLTALMSGLMPAVQASRASSSELLKDAARGSSSSRTGRLMRRLIGVEMALSFLLLVLAGLFIRSGANFRATDFAFEPEEVYTARLRLPQDVDDPAQRARAAEALLETIGTLPQVTGAALATAVPGVGGSPIRAVLVEGRAPTDDPAGSRARAIVVSPGFFALFRAPLLAGRPLDARDRADAPPVAIVNEAFARRYFPGGALDARFRYADDEAGAWVRVVGVTSDLLAGGLEGEVEEAIYLPFAQHPRDEAMIVARPRGDFATAAAPIREAVAAFDPDAALHAVQPLERVIAGANSQYTWLSLLFLVSGGIALFLAAIGLYGVMAFWVIQRTRELGVRMALGGRRGDIVRLVLAQGLRQISVGLAAGVLLALPAAGLLRSALYGVAPYDPAVFGAIIAVLVAAAGLGCWFPARRATRLDPLRALSRD